MTNEVFTYREGTTEPVDIVLYNNDVVADITGYTKISIFLRSADGLTQSEAATTDSGITIILANAGQIRLDPTKLTTALTYAKGSYFGYIIVEDSVTKRTSFPSNGNFTIQMLERYSGDG